MYLLGSLSGFPQWALDHEPFAHIPRTGDGGFSAVPLLWLLAIEVVLIVLGVTGYRRRDTV